MRNNFLYLKLFVFVSLIFFMLNNLSVHSNQETSQTFSNLRVQNFYPSQNVSVRSFRIDEVNKDQINSHLFISNRTLTVYPELFITTRLLSNQETSKNNLINEHKFPFSLEKFQSKKIEMIHSIPPNLPSGDYVFFVQLNDRFGNVYTYHKQSLKDFEIGSDSKEFIEFEIRDFRVLNDTHEVDLTIKNTSNQFVRTYPKIEIFKKNIKQNHENSDDKPSQKTINLMPGQSNSFSLQFPVIKEPGTYTANIIFADELDNQITPVLSKSFVIPGDYATISASLVNYIEDEEMLKIDVFYIGKEDASFISEETVMKDVEIILEILDNSQNLIHKEVKLANIFPFTNKTEFFLEFNPDLKTIFVNTKLVKSGLLLDQFSMIYSGTALLEQPDSSKLDQIISIDIPDVVNTPYSDSVQFLRNLNVIKGYEDGSFKPENPINRAEFMTMVYKILYPDNEPVFQNEKRIFSDVDSSHWAYDFIQRGSSLNLLKGYPDGTFRPNNNISYPEAFTICIRMITNDAELAKMRVWPDDYVKAAISKNLNDGISFEEISNNENATRGNIANILARVYEILN
jgi:hypothetical protein